MAQDEDLKLTNILVIIKVGRHGCQVGSGIH